MAEGMKIQVKESIRSRNKYISKKLKIGLHGIVTKLSKNGNANVHFTKSGEAHWVSKKDFGKLTIFEKVDKKSGGAKPKKVAGEKPKVSEYAKWMEGGDTAATGSGTEITDSDGDSQVDAGPQESAKVVALRAADTAAKAAYEEAKDAVRDRKYLLWGVQAGLDERLVDHYRTLATLQDVCVSNTYREMTFRLCFFKGAYQDTPEQKNLNLGRWMGWEMSPEGFPMGRFDRGTACANGVRRKLTATFHCGPEAKLLHTSEPETCVYAAKVVHPAACNPLERPDSRPPQPRLPHHDEL